LGVTLVHRDFLDAMGRDLVDRELHVGRVIAAGEWLREWQCVHPKQRTIVRGTTRAGFRPCGSCGRDVYSAREWDNLCPPPPQAAQILSTATGGSLVVTGEVLARIDRAKWKGLNAKRLDVLDQPRDGLPRDLKP
jgi:alkylhydroperoxidase family enzyme